ncbi:hypothetical protein FPOAC1_001648 [Fusarium poae]|uniref:hypothetical protein n=1 Tax=Fusarium poae TaxID=36050 RepID=UPI001CE828A5|nr:hypothetical protein FPOAC1_001648 [Fusarium poae]KAG8675662.1 hypothetical protein FPOAC1_001648 [Fusarium poae]
MSSLVSDFLINPVLRQARRFSEISRSTFIGNGGDSTEHADAVSDSSHADSPVSSPVSISAPDPAPVPIVDSPLTRPLSVSTLETRVEEPEPVPIMSQDSPPRDHIGIALSPLSSRRIPEDDGMRELRSRIHIINGKDIPQSEKARLIHDVLLEGYTSSKAVPIVKKILENGGNLDQPLSQSPSSRPSMFWQNQPEEETFVLTEEDKTPTFVPVKPPKRHGSETPVEPFDVLQESEQPLGCQHYERNVKLQCFTCKKCQFRNLDVAIQTQPMPPEFRDTTAVILCNDLELNIIGGDRSTAQPSMNDEGQPVVESGREPSGSISGNRGVAVGNRRRHSSHAAETQFRAPDRVARSVSPGNLGFDSIMSHLPPNEEDEDDILGLWRSRNRANASDNDEDSELDDLSDALSDAEEEEDDEDEDDDNDIVLFGHR